jgi:hypothetical protein
MSYNNDLSMKYLPFNSFSIEKKLPYIPTLINEDKKKIQLDLQLLRLNSGNLPSIQKLFHRNFGRRITRRLTREKTSTRKLNTEESFDDSPRLIENRILRNKNRLINKLQKKEINPYSYSPTKGVFLTNFSQGITNDDSSFINNSSSISISRISSGRKKKMSMKEKENLIRNIVYLNLESNDTLNKLQRSIENNNNYEKSMINKCDDTLKYYDKKYKIQSDEFLNENIDNKDDLNLKFNEFFDKMFSQNKEFDYYVIMRAIKEMEKKKIIHRDRELKIEKRHDKFYKLIKNNQKEAKKAYDLIDEIKKKRLKEIEEYKMKSKKFYENQNGYI